MTLKPWSQALPENVPAEANARFEVEAMGVAIGALPAVERDHNAYTVRMVLRDIFDHSGNSTQIAKPQSTIHQASQSQMSTLSRFIVGAAI